MIWCQFRHSLNTSPSKKKIISLLGISLLISLAVIVSAAWSIQPGTTPIQTPVLYYHDGDHHFLVFFENVFGDPLSGGTVNVTLGDSPIYTGSSVTDSSGLASIAVQAPLSNYNVTISERLGSFSSTIGPMRLPNIPAGQVYSFEGAPISLVNNRTNQSSHNIQVFYTGNNGTIPLGYGLYYSIITHQDNPSVSKSRMTLLGNMTAFHQIFSLPVPSNLNDSSQIWFALFNPNGTAVSGGVQSYSPSTLR